MNRPDNADLLRRALAPRARGAPPPTSECPDDGTIAALADGMLPAADRARLLPHLASCAACRAAVASVARALADPAVAREVRAAEGGGWRRIRWSGGMAAGVAAAALMILLLSLPPRPGEPLPTHRAAPITAAPAAHAVWPVGTVADVTSLRWTSVAGADRYRVTLFTADGAVMYETEVRDTVVVLPDPVVPLLVATYWWKVDTRLGFDRWAASELFEFSVVEPRP